jgi:hypothetical protein
MIRMLACVTGLFLAALGPCVVGAQTPERGFLDLYFGAVGLLESDVPEWTFADAHVTGGARAGVWIRENWAITFRTWYFQTDAKQLRVSPSDLSYLGLSLELLARWRLSDRWSIYGTLGPMVAVTSLDLQEESAQARRDRDDRSLAPGASLSVGVETQLLGRIRGFAEVQTTLVYPHYDFPDQNITPRLLNLYGLVGARIPF